MNGSATPQLPKYRGVAKGKKLTTVSALETGKLFYSLSAFKATLIKKTV